MHETSKAVPRRIRDPNFLSRYFVGRGLDVGCGEDWLGLYAELFPLMGLVHRYDRVVDPAHDAETLPGVADGSYDFVHASHVLEHVDDPLRAIGHWLRVTKPGGHVVILVPDEDMYERGYWPSQGNADHRRTFTLWKRASWSPVSCSLSEIWRAVADAEFEILKMEALTQTYRYTLGLTDPAGAPIDQTATPVGECAIEIVLRKWDHEDAARLGRWSAARPA